MLQQDDRQIISDRLNAKNPTDALILHLVFGALLLIVYWIASFGTPICFDDCHDYTALMGKSGLEYLQIWRESFRPWGVPTFFSLFGAYSIESATRIVLTQSILAGLAWMIFAAVFARTLLRDDKMRIVGFCVLSLLMFGQGYYLFNQCLLSDSLALSSLLTQWSLAMLFPAFVAWVEERGLPRLYVNLYLTVFVCVSAFAVATRDSNIMLVCSGFAFLIWASPKSSFGPGARERVVLFTIGLILAQIMVARTRHSLNATHILVGVALPNAEMRGFFQERGLPPALTQLADRLAPQDMGNLDLNQSIWALGALESLNQAPGVQEFVRRIDGLYVRYLVTHPGFVIDNLWRNARIIFRFQLKSQDPPASPPFGDVNRGDMTPFVVPAALELSPADYVPPAAGVVLLLASLALPFMRREKMAFVPAGVAFIGAGNAVMGFFGDVWERSEMTRHAAIGSVLLHCGLTLCGLMLLDEAARRGFFRGRLRRIYKKAENPAPKLP